MESYDDSSERGENHSKLLKENDILNGHKISKVNRL